MSRFEDVADISFIDDLNLETLKNNAINEYKTKYAEITGNDIAVDDETKAEIYTFAELYYQFALSFDQKAKMNLLKYSSGKYLDNLALSRGLKRKKAEAAIVTIRFTLSAQRDNTIVIPKGTRITSAAARIYFSTNDYTEIRPGELYADVVCTATITGDITNDFLIGDLSILVDPIAYVASVYNIEIPSGGGDEETDDTFAKRIYAARYEYSTTGAEAAYIYYVKSFSSAIKDVVPTNPSDAEIVIYILMSDGTQATDGFIAELTDYIRTPEIKAMTDHITVKNAERVEYSIKGQYYISKNDISRLTNIQSAVTEAIEKYKLWQSEKMGRDINPQELIARLKQAGVRRVVFDSDALQIVGKTQVAYCTDTIIEYAGAEDE